MPITDESIHLRIQASLEKRGFLDDAFETVKAFGETVSAKVQEALTPDVPALKAPSPTSTTNDSSYTAAAPKPAASPKWAAPSLFSGASALMGFAEPKGAEEDPRFIPGAPVTYSYGTHETKVNGRNLFAVIWPIVGAITGGGMGRWGSDFS